jgi:mannobiose 2-epimerase
MNTPDHATGPAPTADELRTALHQHVLDVWFPRSLDHAHGGFLCDFDRAWNPTGPHDKFLEFQARHTLVAAETAAAFPADPRLRAAAEHGFRYLRDVMWDADAGGWFHRLDRAGRPLEGQTKHVHGTAYAIQACAAVYALTGDPAPLRLARDGFDWMERFARDPVHGGYFELLDRGGAVIRDAADYPFPTATDTVGTPIGFKGLNAHSDLVETFAALHALWPDARVRDRLAELVGLFTDRLIGPAGELPFVYLDDWTPFPDLIRFGYVFLTAWRLPPAAAVLGDAGRARAAARRLVRHALRYALDEQTGGFVYAGPGAGPVVIQGRDVRVRRKEWWIQFEALRALLDQHHRDPEDGTYARAFAALWGYVRRHLLDTEYGGVYFSDSDTRKGELWKDASHEGRMLLACATGLRGPGGTESPGGGSQRPTRSLSD